MPGQILQELKQTKPFTRLEEEALVSLARTAAVIEHAAEDMLGRHGITNTQYNVLRILRGAGKNGRCRNEIGERMVRRVPDVTRLLDRLEAAGLVERERDGEDRRMVTARITPEGLKLLTRLEEPLIAFQQNCLAHLGPQKLRTLIDLLAAAREKL